VADLQPVARCSTPTPPCVCRPRDAAAERPAGRVAPGTPVHCQVCDPSRHDQQRGRKTSPGDARVAALPPSVQPLTADVLCMLLVPQDRLQPLETWPPKAPIFSVYTGVSEVKHAREKCLVPAGARCSREGCSPRVEGHLGASQTPSGRLHMPPTHGEHTAMFSRSAERLHSTQSASSRGSDTVEGGRVCAGAHHPVSPLRETALVLSSTPSVSSVAAQRSQPATALCRAASNGQQKGWICLPVKFRLAGFQSIDFPGRAWRLPAGLYLAHAPPACLSRPAPPLPGASPSPQDPPGAFRSCAPSSPPRRPSSMSSCPS
jgi:hypothetical protein